MASVPSRRQWTAWSLPAKASYIGAALGLISLIVMFLQSYWASRDTIPPDTKASQISVSPQSPNINSVKGDVSIKYEGPAVERPLRMDK